MNRAFGIVNSSGKNFRVEGMQAYRPVGAFSFVGRYRIIDFPISNLSNSNIDRIQVYVSDKPRSLVEHVGTGRHYNINSKRGKLRVLFSEDGIENNYDTDISAYSSNMNYIEKMHHTYVVIVPSYMVYTQDFDQLLDTHIASNADVTLLYHNVDNANCAHLNCRFLNMEHDKQVTSLEVNQGSAKNRSIFMDTYVMKKDLLIKMIQKAKSLSSMYTLSDIINLSCQDLDIRGVKHRGYFSSITDFKSYFDSNQELLDIKTARTLFNNDWPIYTRTNDSCPTHYFDTASVKASIISNGCTISGTVENSILGRGCCIKKGAVVRNCIVLANSTISEDTYLENQVIDKQATVLHMKKIVSSREHPGYIKRNDIL